MGWSSTLGVSVDGLSLSLTVKVARNTAAVMVDPTGILAELADRTCARFDGAFGITRYPKMGTHICGNPPQPLLIVDSLGENLAFAKVVQDLPELPKWKE